MLKHIVGEDTVGKIHVEDTVSCFSLWCDSFLKRAYLLYI